MINTLKVENKAIFENMKEYFMTNPKAKTENKQVEFFITILKLLIKNMEENIEMEDLNQKKHFIILESIFNDFCEHLNINSINVSKIKIFTTYYFRDAYLLDSSGIKTHNIIINLSKSFPNKLLI